MFRLLRFKNRSNIKFKLNFHQQKQRIAKVGKSCQIAAAQKSERK